MAWRIRAHIIPNACKWYTDQVWYRGYVCILEAGFERSQQVGVETVLENPILEMLSLYIFQIPCSIKRERPLNIGHSPTEAVDSIRVTYDEN
jgi:hypothetical protein